MSTPVASPEITLEVLKFDSDSRTRIAIETAIIDRLIANEFPGGALKFTFDQKTRAKGKPVGVYWIKTTTPSEDILIVLPSDKNVGYRGYLTPQGSAKKTLEDYNLLREKKDHKKFMDFLAEPILKLPPKKAPESQKVIPISLPLAPKPAPVPVKQESPVVVLDPSSSVVQLDTKKEEKKEILKKEEITPMESQVLEFFKSSCTPEGLLGGEFAEKFNSSSVCPKGKCMDRWVAGRTLTAFVEKGLIGYHKKGVYKRYTISLDQIDEDSKGQKPEPTQIQQEPPAKPKVMDVTSVSIHQGIALLQEEQTIAGRLAEIAVLNEGKKGRIAELTQQIATLQATLQTLEQETNPLVEEEVLLNARLAEISPIVGQIRQLRELIA